MTYTMNREEMQPRWFINEDGETEYLPEPENIKVAVERAVEQIANDSELALQYMPLTKRLCHQIAKAMNIDYEGVIGKTRFRPYPDARAVVYMILRETNPLRYTYPKIGQSFNRDHSTIIHACENFDVYCKRNPKLFGIYKKLGGQRES